MQYSEAFKALGYTLENRRGDWSAESPSGVCLAIWRKDLKVANELLCLDLLEAWEHRLEEAEPWMTKSGHKKRTRHLQRATQEFDGKVDVIFVSGTPGESYEDADPWIQSKRGGHWRLTKFCPSTGLFRVEVKKNSS